jgi:hypothetical protein
MKNLSKIIAFLLLILSSLSLYGQDMTSKSVELELARSKHGSGDLTGFSFASNYIFTKNRFSQLVFIEGSIHDGEYTLIFDTPDGLTNDGSIRYTTAGVQVGYGVRYSLFEFKNQKTEVGLNGLIRYQSTSLYDTVTILFPALTDIPFPVVVLGQESDARTIALGSKLILSHRVALTKTIDLKALGSFQYDTNGDTIGGYGLGISKRW